MKNLSLTQMENLEGGSFDCSGGAVLSFIGGAGTAGALLGPFGFLAGVGGSVLYTIYQCNTEFR